MESNNSYNSITVTLHCQRDKIVQKKILTGERTVLNFIQRMCGIATSTTYFVSLVENTDIIMLDNMGYDLMKESIDQIDGRAEVEVSGNIDEKRINEIKDFKIDYISIGALTHSVKALDLSMKFD